MSSPDYPVPLDEEQRLRDLQRHAVLDTPSDPHFERIVSLAAEVLDMPIAVVSLVDQNRQWFLARHGLDAEETPRRVAFCAHTISQDSVLVVPDALKDERFSNNPLVLSEPHIRFYAGAPLHSPEGHNLGTLCVIDQKPRQLAPQQQQLLQMMADLVMRELDLRQQSLRCPVTGLFNRSSFFRFAEIELQHARRSGTPLCLLNVDIDDFRQINNRWGHQAGDRVLLDVCQTIQQRLKPEDLFGRIGDEEFAILFVNCNVADAMHLAEEIRLDIAGMPGVFHHSDYHPYISGGLTSLSPADQAFSDLFYRADQALYLAKGNGRNQIARVIEQQ
ncbi:MAG: GGDEF domain-containing protein [Vulcanococcus sp.]